MNEGGEPSGGEFSGATRGDAELEPPFAREGFPVLRAVPLRWADIDRYGHANNVAYLSWFDTAVNGLYAEHGFMETTDPHFIVARTGCSYFREIGLGDDVRIGMRIRRLGRTSATFDLAVFIGDEEEARAQGTFVHVLVSDAAKRPIPIEGAFRALLATLVAP